MPDSYLIDTRNFQTIIDFLRFGLSQANAQSLHYGHGTDNAWDDILALVLGCLHLPHDVDSMLLQARLTDTEKSMLCEQLEQRILARVPVPYLTHEAYFCDLSFYVDERVIVPRSFIAELLQESLFPWVETPEKIHSVLDMCTGSGCLAILAAHVFHEATVDAVDLSNDALAVAVRNVDDYKLKERIRLIESNLFAKLGDKKYDIIISNPPYVDADSVAALPAEYLHEPKLALGSGKDGLDATREILKQAAARLNPGGILIVEIGHNRDALEAAYPKLPFNWLTVSAGDEFVFLLHREDLI